MSATLRNRLQRAEDRLVLVKASTEGQLQQVRRVVLASLNDRDLRHLQDGLSGEARDSLAAAEPEAIARYGKAFDTAAIRLTGATCPMGVLPLELVAGEIANRSQSKLRTMFPDEGAYRRELYPKQLEFFRAGRDHREVAFIAGNRCGKSEAGAYQTALHLTGRYPDWWEGRRFDKPVNVWVASDTNQTTRDILQAKLLGGIVPAPKRSPRQTTGSGSGMIPANTIVHTQPKSCMPGAIETVYVRHISGGYSRLTFKSYQQGREAFQGTEQDLIVCDEEPPMQVYAEALTRTMATGTFAGGLILLLFTPLNGWSEVVESFLNPEKCSADRYCVQAGWDQVPHLSEAEKESMLAAYPLYQRDPRSKGIPQLGSGAIYPLAESQIAVDPFLIPPSWRRVYGLDVGWNRTAALWLVQDPESGTLYAYAEHYYAHSEPSENARAIRERGDWIRGVIDPAANGRSQTDGYQLIEKYRELGLHLEPAENTVEAGLSTVWELFVSNRLKICKNLASFWQEFRLYRRDDKGKVVKDNDHLMDSLRYAIMSGRDRMRPEPVKTDPNLAGSRAPNWMA